MADPIRSQDIFPLVAAGDCEGARRLLDADPGLANVRNTTKDAWDESFPLTSAAKYGHLEIVKLLVERGAEVYTNPFNTYPAVIMAAWKKHQHVVDFFLNEIPDQAHGTCGLGVMINLAAREGWAEIVRQHIERDPLAVHQRGWIGDTPLHWPAHNGNVEIVRMLLDAGAAIEADEIGCYGGKPLHGASEHSPETVKLLLERGADVNSRNVNVGSKFLGMTPLIMNATQNDDCAEVTELLLAAGADIRATDAQGRSALDHAAAGGRKRIVEVLRQHGAD